MSFWNYISEFFLFRWLSGRLKHKETRPDVLDSMFNTAD